MDQIKFTHRFLMAKQDYLIYLHHMWNSDHYKTHLTQRICRPKNEIKQNNLPEILYEILGYQMEATTKLLTFKTNTFQFLINKNC